MTMFRWRKGQNKRNFQYDPVSLNVALGNVAVIFSFFFFLPFCWTIFFSFYFVSLKYFFNSFVESIRTSCCFLHANECTRNQCWFLCNEEKNKTKKLNQNIDTSSFHCAWPLNGSPFSLQASKALGVVALVWNKSEKKKWE